MKNNKIFFLVAIVCCLVVAFACFCGFTPPTDKYYIYVNLTNFTTADFANYFSFNTLRGSGNNPLAGTANFKAVTLSYTILDDTTLRFDIANNGSNQMYYISLMSIDTSFGIGYFSNMTIYDSSSNPATVSGQSFSSSYAIVVVPYSFNGNYTVLDLSLVDSGVPQEQYDELLQRYEDLEYDFSDLESDYDDLQIEVQEYIALYNQELAINTALNTRIEELQARIDTLESGGSALDFIGNAFEKVGDILQIEILPNITIGTIVAIPLILGVVFLVLRLVRGE